MPSYKKYTKLIIGCGIKKEKDAWNIDYNKKVSPDQIVNLEKNMPFKDNHFRVLVADFVLCQICDKRKFIKTMNECWRILKSDGIFKIKVPNAQFPCAFQDPLDCRFFVKESFDYFNYKHYRYQVFHCGFKPWRILKIKKISGGKSKIKDRLYVEMSPHKK